MNRRYIHNMNKCYKYSSGQKKKSKIQKKTYSMIPFIKSLKVSKTNQSCLGMNNSVVKYKKKSQECVPWGVGGSAWHWRGLEEEGSELRPVS